MKTGGGRSAVLVGAAAALVLAGCTYEETVYWRPALSSAPGAISGGEEFSEKPKGYRDPTQLDDGRIRVESEDGSAVLVARTARHLMAHIYSTLKEDERDLFIEQVLCEQTKKEFRERDMSPAEAFDYLKSREQDVAALFARMPMGEFFARRDEHAAAGRGDAGDAEPGRGRRLAVARVRHGLGGRPDGQRGRAGARAGDGADARGGGGGDRVCQRGAGDDPAGQGQEADAAVHPERVEAAVVCEHE
ncbi:MAG: hypothetical protein HND58_07780 [Planctomycetota bacterium]|nr:MAG: hypothetical protein HND58_07780 [Planctomycetota bacterium]